MKIYKCDVCGDKFSNGIKNNEYSSKTNVAFGDNWCDMFININVNPLELKSPRELDVCWHCMAAVLREKLL